PPNLADSTVVIAAVSVVLPWSTWPIVPTLMCGLVRSHFPFAIFPLLTKSQDLQKLVPMAGIGPATSPLPRECSTTEPHGRILVRLVCPSMPFVERETGIEPASLALKAKVLPLNYSRFGDGSFNGLSALPTRAPVTATTQ